MSNQKLIQGVIIGAVVGGLVTMFDRNTRNAVWDNLKKTGTSANNYVKQPSEAIHCLRNYYENLSTDLLKGINSTISVLSQLQETLDALNQPQSNGNQLTTTEELKIVTK